MQQKLGKTIRSYRNKKGYTITELANKLNVSVGLISNIETGKTDSFQLVLLNNIIKELDIPLSEVRLFSTPYTIDNLNTKCKNINKIQPQINSLINSFIETSSVLDFNKDKINLITNMIIHELKTIIKIKMAESK
ncbi:DNA-binding protein [Clostridium sp. K25]|uniref:helix-turn-helix domain-containing protein n=1 Tax=Clostridium sp. K25 TaxID=1443109 RepID=UPI0004D9762B|nr:helix-turn-helix transcriptional regulator [Clostridium sp. K25]KEI06590.1 DNA-binding protein [Clostridium sp. K25]